ncbi:MAG: hypothetical protein DHS20C03_04440 [Minwuia thermotolerans]|nr:MAG: hypothetical protein DHS20C03_04440 [Minwuia thermotolerans]
MMRSLILLLLVLAVGVSACGKKGEPLTPSESARQQAEQENKQQRKNAE